MYESYKIILKIYKFWKYVWIYGIMLELIKLNDENKIKYIK